MWMKKRVWAGVIAALITGLGFIIFIPRKSDAPTKEIATPSNNSSQSSQTSYVEYSDDLIAKTTGKKVLFFHAQWCPQCRMIETDILKQGAPEGWTIIKVDYDSHQDLRQKYGVTIQTTFVKIDDAGNSLNKYVAYQQPTLESVNINYLSKP